MFLVWLENLLGYSILQTILVVVLKCWFCCLVYAVCCTHVQHIYSLYAIPYRVFHILVCCFICWSDFVCNCLLICATMLALYVGAWKIPLRYFIFKLPSHNSIHYQFKQGASKRVKVSPNILNKHDVEWFVPKITTYKSLMKNTNCMAENFSNILSYTPFTYEYPIYHSRTSRFLEALFLPVLRMRTASLKT